MQPPTARSLKRSGLRGKPTGAVSRLPEPPRSTCKPTENPKIHLALPYGTTTPAYHYADVMPEFPDLSKFLPSQTQRNFIRLTNERKAGLGQNLSLFLQVQFRYPPQALRNGEQGTVVAYFEVSETGAVENRRIVGTAGRSLDAEVLRVLQRLPAATAPAQVAGRPARLYFTVPCAFKVL